MDAFRVTFGSDGRSLFGFGGGLAFNHLRIIPPSESGVVPVRSKPLRIALAGKMELDVVHLVGAGSETLGTFGNEFSDHRGEVIRLMNDQVIRVVPTN